MKTILHRFCTLLLFRLVPLAIVLQPVNAFGEEAAGDWGGSLGGQLRIVLHIAKVGAGAYTATLKSPDQGDFVLEADRVSATADRLSLTIPKINGSYDATWDAGQQAWKGVWKQGQSIPLTLSRLNAKGEVRQPRRPQEEAIAAGKRPYRSEDVTIRNSSVMLAGTYSVPEGPGPFPAVVLLSGSGPQTRDEVIGGHKVFVVLADALLRRGVAVLRYDKRGTGASAGDFAAATAPDFASDAEAAVAYLTSRSEVDQKRIGLVGHSEGGAIAPTVAGRNASVAFVVLLAAPALRTDRLTLLQEERMARAQGAAEEAIAARRSFGESLYGGVLNSRSPEEAAAVAKRLVTQAVESGLLPKSAAEETILQVTSPWFRQAIGYDPAPALRRLRKPVLALYASLDLLVPAKENQPVMLEALSGNSKATVRELAGLNHMFQTAVKGLPSEYGQIEETFSPEALRTIAEWVSSQGAAGEGSARP